jgi:dienelactone hydrolase
MQLTAEDGHVLSAYRADPKGTPRGAVVVIQEIFGVNHHIRSVVDSFARDGYATIAPAMYDRYERDVDMGYTPDTTKKGRALKAKAKLDPAMLDVRAARWPPSHQQARLASSVTAGAATSRGWHRRSSTASHARCRTTAAASSTTRTSRRAAR